MLPPDRTFRLPAVPPAPPRPAFPLLAVAAPIAVSAVIFAITGSAYVLLFAALGPVIAVATVLDSRRAARRGARREREATRRAHDALRAALTDHLAELREQAWDAAPDAAAILSGHADHRRWAPRPAEDAMPVVLGTGSLPSDIRLDGGADGSPATGDGEGVRADEEALRRFASRLTEVPLVAGLADGVGIVGPLPLARAVARGLVVQAAHLNAPGRVAFRAGDHPEWGWVGHLPHAAARSPAALVTVCEPGHRHDRSCLLALAEHAEQLPPGCGTVLRLTGTGGAVVVRAPGGIAGSGLRPELVSVADAARFAGELREAARAAGLTGNERGLPVRVGAAELWRDTERGPEPGATRTLASPVGIGEEGSVTVDLVREGPHAVVGGTTGSGKSELLVTWVTAMAGAYPPEQVTFLLVDFKGGSAFQPLSGLPHCVGIVTDLGEGEAARALASLRAEIRHRERVLRDVGARDVADAQAAGRLPRLVIVVDEFQAMLTDFDDLHQLFADLAARGRSLGIHLILCTQRPAGVVRDSLLANCNLRLSLRVNNRADSVAVIGAPDAAELRPSEPGRCLISGGDGMVRLCHVAVTEQEDIAKIARRSHRAEPPRRPWLDPLPATVTMAGLAGLADVTGEADAGARILGLLDEPEEQRYRIATYRPAHQGHLLVIGGPGSGKTGLVDTLAAQGQGEDWVVPPTLEGAWDALATATIMLDRPGSATTGTDASTRHPLLLLDDFDAVFARWAPEYQAAALDRLAVLLRQGTEAGLGIVITVQRLTAQLGQLAGLCPALLLLGLPSREAHRAAGGDPVQYDPTLPPGGGRWEGSRVQLMAPPEPDARHVAKHGGVEPIPAGRAVLVVSGAPARTATELRGRRGDAAVVELGTARPGQLELQELGGGTAIVGDPDSWQSHFGLLAALRPRTDIVFDHCTLGDYRLVSRRRELPPVLAPNSGQVWLLTPDGAVRRAEWS